MTKDDRIVSLQRASELKMQTIVLAEDHEMVREGLKHLLSEDGSLTVVGEAADGLRAVELVEKLKPSILLLDLLISRLHGLEVIRRLQSERQTKIVVVSMYAQQPYLIESLKSGASAYVIKDASAKELISAIHAVGRGDLFVSPSLRHIAMDASLRQLSRGAPFDSHNVSKRERLVLQLAASGDTSAMIASKLFVSPRTVETHRSSLMKKLGLKNQTDLVRYAIRENIIDA
jgi:two-component system response regulator NreC